ncbi:hypothetical protein D3C72_2350620 [compost metagenome]
MAPMLGPGWELVPGNRAGHIGAMRLVEAFGKAAEGRLHGGARGFLSRPVPAGRGAFAMGVGALDKVCEFRCPQELLGRKRGQRAP